MLAREEPVMTTVLDVKNLTVRFAIRNKGAKFGAKSYLTAVDEIDFHVLKGQTLAIVGESGSGKTTAALAVAQLAAGEVSGEISLDGADLFSLDQKTMRQRLQVIFQDPYSSLNPRRRAKDIVSEPLDSLTTLSATEKDKIIDDLFAAVGLRQEQKNLFPHQFSGGQRQRIGIARALATRPDVIICDEPVSALDVAVQAQILNLLRKLQKELGLTYLFISHDLGVVQHMSDSIIVMYMGKIVEHADRISLFSTPRHPYTQALLSAIPSVDVDPEQNGKRILIPGDPPDPLNLPKGCRFQSRCPFAQDICAQRDPELASITPDQKVACHFPITY
jgi:peptide/nickel transport system ATP-binding protein